ncbi:testis-expressed protein 47, partial [Columba livia]|uniref:testis-expressed protein 47 n=1 Tax=Columba livia TaxID=8932 RepID=UPI0031B9E7C5
NPRRDHPPPHSTSIKGPGDALPSPPPALCGAPQTRNKERALPPGVCARGAPARPWRRSPRRGAVRTRRSPRPCGGTTCWASGGTAPGRWAGSGGAGAAPAGRAVRAARPRPAVLPQGRFPLHRLLVLARLRPGAAAEEAAGYHRGLFENSLEDRAREQVSGLLLVYSSHVCHVVESCSSTIHLIIQDLASLQSQGHGALLQEIKVLVVAHNIPTRLFPDWYVAVAPSPVTSAQRTAEPQPTAELVAELLALLLTLAAGVQSSEDDSEDTLESVHTLAPELLIPAETINSLYNAEECASPEDFLSIYLSPSQPALDSETVWPVPSHPTP